MDPVLKLERIVTGQLWENAQPDLTASKCVAQKVAAVRSERGSRCQRRIPMFVDRRPSE